MPGRYTSFFLLLAAAILIISAPAGVTAAGKEGEVYCPPMSNGAVLIRIRTSAGGKSPAQRAAVISRRLERLFNAGLKKSDIEVGRRGGQVVVLAKKELIATADAAHARINRTTPQALAAGWADNIKAYLE